MPIGYTSSLVEVWNHDIKKNCYILSKQKLLVFRKALFGSRETRKERLWNIRQKTHVINCGNKSNVLKCGFIMHAVQQCMANNRFVRWLNRLCKTERKWSFYYNNCTNIHSSMDVCMLHASIDPTIHTYIHTKINNWKYLKIMKR